LLLDQCCDLTFLLCLVPHVERVGDVQVWPDKDHIAITNGDTSTTRRKSSCTGIPSYSPRSPSLRGSSAIPVILSRRFRKNNCPAGIGRPLFRRAGYSAGSGGRRPRNLLGTQFARSNPANARQRLQARVYMAAASSHSSRAAPSMAARISAAD